VDFKFSEEEEAFRSTVRDWVNDKCPKDYALEIERQEDHDGSNFPEELWQNMAEAGFFGIGIDEELGGQGGNCTIQSIFMEEIARSLGGIAWIWGVNQFNTKSIQRFASDSLKQELIPQLVEGKVKTAIAVTEPGAGTDLLGGMITTAVPDGDGFRINGAKIWSTMAHVSDYLLLLATTDPNAEKASRGKTLFLVDAKQDGVVARTIPKLGMRCVGSCEVQLDNAYVPSTHVIGEVNKGWGHILSTLNNERILVAAMCTGILRAVIEEAVAYATEREAFGKKIGEFQSISHWICRWASCRQSSSPTRRPGCSTRTSPAASSPRPPRRSAPSTRRGRPTAGSRSRAGWATRPSTRCSATGATSGSTRSAP
jgi:acyl-CoA dehydrogenase